MIQPNKARILQVLEDDMLAHHRVYASLPGSVIYDQPDCFFYSSKINFGAYGGVLAQRFEAGRAPQRVDEIHALIRQTGKNIGWVLSPICTPENLEEIIVRSGARKVVELKGMAMNMAEIAQPEPNTQLRIKIVENERELIEYASIYPLLFHEPVEDWLDQLIEAELHVFRNNAAPWRRWLAYIDGKPGAACRSCQVCGVAALQILCTLPEYRNRGIGQLLATHGLIHEGCDEAIVWSGPNADRMYARMGFRQVCRTSV